MSESEKDGRVPIGEVLASAGLHPLDDGWNALEAFVLIKCLDADGDSRWVYRTTAPPNREELLGALIVHVEVLRRELVAEWEDEDD